MIEDKLNKLEKANKISEGLQNTLLEMIKRFNDTTKVDLDSLDI